MLKCVIIIVKLESNFIYTHTSERAQFYTHYEPVQHTCYAYNTQDQYIKSFSKKYIYVYTHTQNQIPLT